LIARKIGRDEKHTAAALQLLSEGATIPFIARYRKDLTGAMDEVMLQQLQEEARFQKEFHDRRAFIEKAITEQRQMTEALQQKLHAAHTLPELEDLYLPFKPKRKTRAQKAREAGLTPLADWLIAQSGGQVEQQAEPYVTAEYVDVPAVLQGARDIIAEQISEDADLRAQLRHLFDTEGSVMTRVVPGKEAEGAKFKDYFDFTEPVSKIPSHRMLAVLRGFMEGVLRLSIAPDEESAVALLRRRYVTAKNEASLQIEKAAKESYRRLLQPALETEIRTALKTRAEDEAIEVFAENLRQLLLSPPLGSQRILAIDPGYRTGCKVVALDETGRLLETALIYIHEKNDRLLQAEDTIRSMVKRFEIACFAIGDGTAGRETAQFIKSLALGLPIFMVNEDGASVYSASEAAREEFPDQDITVRGAVSIGRRLMDPLAELVKIDPKSIGVGQYQHDVNPSKLKAKLDQTVVHCVHAVGVNLNTAGKHLLQYVSGIGPSLASHIIRYREQQGGFSSRAELLQIPRMGTAAYEQSAGFLRIKHGTQPLDASGVHPEAYDLVKEMAWDLEIDVTDLIGNEQMIDKIQPARYINNKFGPHTVRDILNELKKPGLDPREKAQTFEFAPIYSLEEVQVGMILPGLVTNITRFGAFVDIGVKQDGLVHISEIAHQYISDPGAVLKLNQPVQVKVLEVDVSRKRISLSIKQATPAPAAKKKRTPRPDPPADNRSWEGALSALKKKYS
jgi:uncharacterized protein